MNKKNIEELKSIIREALEPGVFGYEDRTGIEAFEDDDVRELCERYGYGAVMDSASRMWRKKLAAQGLEGGEHTTAACASVRIAWCERARKALARKDG